MELLKPLEIIPNIRPDLNTSIHCTANLPKKSLNGLISQGSRLMTPRTTRMFWAQGPPQPKADEPRFQALGWDSLSHRIMDIYQLLSNILAIALPLSLLEISFERDEGWGAGLGKDTWYGKIFSENSLLQFIAKIVGVPYFFGYALFAYFFFVPLLLVFEYFYFGRDVLFLLATYMGVLVAEDFLWFVLNPYFPSLRELLKGPQGSIWWHKRWVGIGKYYLPASYFTGALLVICLILISHLSKI